MDPHNSRDRIEIHNLYPSTDEEIEGMKKQWKDSRKESISDHRDDSDAGAIVDEDNDSEPKVGVDFSKLRKPQMNSENCTGAGWAH